MSSIAVFPKWDMLDELLKQNPKTIIEIGTYYAGWTKYISDNTSEDAKIFTFQSPHDLTHLESSQTDQHDTLPQEIADTLKLDTDCWPPGDKPNPDWKSSVKKRIPKKYHGMYDFNILAEAVKENKKAIPILCHSPLNFDWPIKYDLGVINITYKVDLNLEQINYWMKYINDDGILCVSTYGTQQQLHEKVSKTFKSTPWGHGYIWISK